MNIDWSLEGILGWWMFHFIDDHLVGKSSYGEMRKRDVF